jgi:hypothetical protein
MTILYTTLGWKMEALKMKNFLFFILSLFAIYPMRLKLSGNNHAKGRHLMEIDT